MNHKIISQALLTSLFCFLITACGGSGDGGKKDPEIIAPVFPPDPVPEITQELSYGDGFTKIDAGINFKTGYKNPTATPLGQGRVPQHPEHFAGGAATGDYDNDGDLDILIVRGDIGPNLLYQNNGQGIFQDVALSAGIANTKSSTENYRHSGPLFVDMNGDGHLDIFIGAVNSDPVKVFQNNRDGTFSDVTATSGLSNLTSEHTISAAASDYDFDGDLDLFLTHWGTSRNVANPDASEHLWRNNSTANSIQFEDVSKTSGITSAILAQPLVSSVLGEDHDATFAPVFVDVDNDQYPDLFVTADFKTSRFLLNNRDGTFRNSRPGLPFEDEAGMGSAVADFDNDGDFDWFVSGIIGEFWPLGNRLYENRSLNFKDVSVNAAVNAPRQNGLQKVSWAWGVCAEDFDGDMNLDLYVTNGFPFAFQNEFVSFDFDKDQTLLFMGFGDNTFEEKLSN
ncbi:MAG: VCBS repeat-containing protein [Cellvibrio sp.]|nr:VCBS repeat-containing protein [Cellvibrio sp.]